MLLLLVVVLGLVGLGVAVLGSRVPEVVDEIRLPLRHEDIIRQQAKDKDLDPALIAAVIYAESRFRDNQVSSAGAIGLMQITPDTARDIARQSGGSAFVLGDLHTAQVNISYGAWRLRHMLQRFHGSLPIAIAGYNAGPENAQKWSDEAAAEGRSFSIARIPFPETRHYVEKVLAAERDYRRTYPKRLGLD
ncbi:Soluble lytic murein transglycosylase precursor [Patulibacter medicamentivorans]|uniref:Soluble lytic murein transglycosylase n=1 Tax=Patulibacter medicamentivorans TaxID=1097667 RepID=H0E1I0_9ACTN|nr:lytic transglycosylase domain-containing protein [Patulibacter medicamentivorans]EHN12465.1 Soluble lytic murein transglycosylase precursor [Patulibacter medicamentivorans]